MPYDPDLIRRLRMIDVAPSSAQMPTQEPDYITDLRNYVRDAPRMAEYRPGLGRKILASIAGGFAGLAGPQAGAAVHESVEYGPYARAKAEYESGLEPRLQIAKIGEEQIRQQREQERARAYGSAQKAREAYYNFEMNKPEKPIVLPKDARLIAPGQQPIEGYHAPEKPMIVPRGGTVMKEGEEPFTPSPVPSPYGFEAEGFYGRTRGKTAEEQRKSQERQTGQRIAGAGARAKLRADTAKEIAGMRGQGGPSATSQATADRTAQRRVLTEHPEYLALFDKDLAAKGMFIPRPEIVGTKEHRDYLAYLDRERKRILASQQSRGKSEEYDVEEVEPDEDEDEENQ